MPSVFKDTTMTQSESDISLGKALIDLAADLCRQYEESQNANLIELAIQHSANSVHLLPPDHPDHFLAYHQWAACLWRRSRDIGSREDMELAIQYGKLSMLCCPSSHPKQVYAFNILARALLLRFERCGDRRDLEFALMYYREILATTPADHPELDIVFIGFGNALLYRCRQYGDPEDNELSIKYYLQALAKRPVGHYERPTNLFNLVLAFAMRSAYSGNPKDLHTRIMYAEEALQLCPLGHPFRSFALTCLSSCLTVRFSLYGDPADLDLHIALSFEALSLRPVGHPRRSESLIYIVSSLQARFKRGGIVSDIDASIEYATEALMLTPPGDNRRWTALQLLACTTCDRFEEYGNEEDLQMAIRCCQDALLLFPSSGPHRRFSLVNLAGTLRFRFEQSGDINDLETSITYLHEAYIIASAPFYVKFASSFAATLICRYRFLHNVEDLNLAFDYLHKAQQQKQPGDDSSVNIFARFAEVYVLRHLVDPNPLNRQRAFFYYEKATSHISGSLRDRLRTSIDWIGYAHSQQQHTSELKAYQVSLTLLDQYFMITPHVSLRHEIHKTKIPPTLTADAASCAVVAGKLELAVELLEYGRALLWTQLTRIRTPLDVVRDHDENGKRLAEEFASLCRQLEMNNISPMIPTDPARSESTRNYAALTRHWQTVVEEIRKINEFSNFLAPPPFKELQIAAAEGPIIIPNVGYFRSDTLVILKGEPPRIVSLQLTLQEVHQMSMEFNDIFRIYTRRGEERRRGGHLIPLLRRLWNCVVHPVVCELESVIPRGSRIWWCPTSALGSLPLHAAGPYCRGKLNLPDIYISSYTPTLSALIRARRPQASPRSLLAIGQPIPYAGFGQEELQMVKRELDIVEKLCSPSISFSRLYGPDATFDAAVDGLRKHNWIHLACHGQQDADNPYKSCFAMGDKPLRLLDVMQAKLDDSHFAFLSACHTAVGDMDTPDEVIHLAAGLQFSGFKSVVGTIGAVDDGTVVDVVTEFYKAIFAAVGHYTDAAQALNQALRVLKRQGLPLDQRVIFIHIGA